MCNNYNNQWRKQNTRVKKKKKDGLQTSIWIKSKQYFTLFSFTEKDSVLLLPYLQLSRLNNTSKEVTRFWLKDNPIFINDNKVLNIN